MGSERFTSAQQVFIAFPMIADDMDTAPEEIAPIAYLDKLAGSPLAEDAVTFAAFLLDKREAVWWAAQCIRQMGSPENRDEELALNTGESWVRDPEEERRIAALDVGMNGNSELPGTWVALAAGAAGGTIMVDDEPGPPVPVQACARAARTAVLVALARMPFRDRPGYILQCVGLCKKLYERERQ